MFPLTSNIQDSAEVGFLQSWVNESVITLDDEPLEETVKDGSGNTSNSSSSLLAGLTLGHPLGSNLDSGLAESLDHGKSIHTKESSYLAWEGVAANLLTLSLVITPLGLELNTTTGHDSSSQHVAIKLLLVREAKHNEGILGVLKLLIVIN